jgi:uncharacterized protein (DUF1501 family)
MKRREFIQKGCMGMGSTTLLSTLANLGMMNGVVSAPKDASTADYKAIVCILLSGGIDSFNMLIPTGVTPSDNGYNDYLGVRTDLARTMANVQSLNQPATGLMCAGHRGIASAYQQFGLHSGLSDLRTLFNQGKLAYMANIGTLVEPLANKTEFNAGIKRVPLGIYSHSDQIMQWQTSVPQSRDAAGFGGRLADLLYAKNANQSVSMNISLAGKNSFQRGMTSTEYSVSNAISAANVGIEPLPSWYQSSGLMNDLRNAAIDNLMSQNYANLLEKTYAQNTSAAKAGYESFKEALKKVPVFNTTMPSDNFGKDLTAIGKIISVRNFLGASRQVFFVNVGGWDMHDGMVTGMNNRLPGIAGALKKFYELTEELGVANQVTTFTISDFARTITSNGNGSDHAWGGNTIVMGGSVNGGRLYGAFPEMNVTTNQRNVNFRGNFIPALSTDEFYAELALWYGVSPSDLCYALPNIGNFYSYAANNYPVGFMNFGSTVLSSQNMPQNCLSY